MGAVDGIVRDTKQLQVIATTQKFTARNAREEIAWLQLYE